MQPPIPPAKSDSPLSQQPSSKNWGPVKPPPLFENLVGDSTPSPQKKRRVHTMLNHRTLLATARGPKCDFLTCQKLTESCFSNQSKLTFCKSLLQNCTVFCTYYWRAGRLSKNIHRYHAMSAKPHWKQREHYWILNLRTILLYGSSKRISDEFKKDET